MKGRADPGIFLCYRRDDTQGYAGWLWESLTERFGRGRVFRDIDEIEPGLNFVEVIDEAMSRCRASLVLIGPRWLSVTDTEGTPRIQLEGDFVRLEVEAALSRDMRVIPVLLQGAEMPTQSVLPETIKPLALRNAVELSESRWHYDVDRLVNVLSLLLESPQTAGELELGKEAEDSDEQITSSGQAIGPSTGTDAMPPPVPVGEDLIGDPLEDLREVIIPPNPVAVAVSDLPVAAKLMDASAPVVGAEVDDAIASASTIIEAPPTMADLPEPNGDAPNGAEGPNPTSALTAAPPTVAPPTVTPPTGAPPPARKRGGMIAAILAGLMILGIGGALLLKAGRADTRSEGDISAPPIGDGQTSTSPPSITSPTPTATAVQPLPKVKPPTHLEATSVGQSVVELRWERPGGQIHVVRYLIIRNGQQIGKTTELTFADEGLSSGTVYHYRVLAVARDSQASSQVLEVTTDAPPAPPPLTPEEQCLAIGGTWLGQECLPP